MGEDELEEKSRLLQLIQAKEKKIALMEGLPFLHGWKWYPWAREFYESTNKLNFLCAANQISKSSTQIRKCINWATDQELWPKLWSRRPIQFWYLYPSQKVVDAEFKTKWSQFLPRGMYKENGPYAWKEIVKNKDTVGIHFFNSGVWVFFKTYTQNVQDLQTGTCDAVFCDEELPVDIYDELIFRVSASEGYFHMVFTATLGQEFWKAVIEQKGEREALPEAAKWQISMYDCLEYEDGTASHWTHEKIQQIKNRCKSHAEVLRRVYGRFVMDTGRKYGQFDILKHMVSPQGPPPPDWFYYAGVDPGSGGDVNHPAAICFVAVRPDFRFGRVFLGWRGDNIETTSGDVVSKFVEMRGDLVMSGQYYDWGDKDFDTISTRSGCPFQKADKSHDTGEDVINVLFKNNMLLIDDTEELQKLGWELANLRLDVAKRKAKDDFCDALRYAVTRIPWDWTAIPGVVPKGDGESARPAKKESDDSRIARRNRLLAQKEEEDRIEAELQEWDELYG